MEHWPDRLAHRRLAPLLRQRLSRRGLDLGEDRRGSRRPGGLAPLAQDLRRALRGPPQGHAAGMAQPTHRDDRHPGPSPLGLAPAHDDAGARGASPLADRQLRGSRRLAGARYLRPLSRVDRRAPGEPAPQARREAAQLGPPTLFFVEEPPSLDELVLSLVVDLGIVKAETAESVHDGRAPHGSREPLVVRGHDVPGRPLGCGAADHGLVSIHVVVPVLALLHVVDRELPELPRIVESLEEPRFLLLLGHVQEELQHHGAVVAEIPLELSDGPIALLEELLGVDLAGKPLPLEQLLVHPYRQHLLVVRAIEDADAPAFGEATSAAPQEVVVELLIAGRLEGGDLASLGIHAGHDVFDRAVLARSVHGLEDEQHRPPLLRVEHVLELAQDLGARGEEALGSGLSLRADAQRVLRIDVVEPELLAIGHPERTRELFRLLDDGLEAHGPSFRRARIPFRSSYLRASDRATDGKADD